MKRNILCGAAAFAMLAGSAYAVEALSNTGFETGDFTSWTQFGNTGFTGVSGVFSGVAPTGGAFQAFFGPVGSTGGITQSAAVAVGDIVTVSFDLYNFGGTPNYFDASFDGTSLLSFTDAGAFTYTTYTFAGIVVGTAGAAMTITTQQNPSYWLLDNVSVDITGHVIPLPTAAGLGLAGLGLVGLRRRR